MNPCPYCAATFASKAMTDTHVRYVHTAGGVVLEPVSARQVAEAYLLRGGSLLPPEPYSRSLRNIMWTATAVGAFAAVLLVVALLVIGSGS
jgi:cytosine/uracil/thiamine/allantoin permease